MSSTSHETRRQVWEERSGPVLTLVAVVFVMAYAWPILDTHLTTIERDVFGVLMDVTWAIFAADYVIRFFLSKHRWRFVTSHPIDLAVVALPMLRPLRLLRLLTVVVVVHRTSANLLRGRVAIYIVGGATFLALVGALSILEAERFAPGSHITTFPDALWWALATMTTVGYGDVYPVTHMGRMVAAGLMIGGIALLGSVTASLASWLTDRLRDADDEPLATRADVDELTRQVAELSRRIEEMTESRTPNQGA